MAQTSIVKFDEIRFLLIDSFLGLIGGQHEHTQRHCLNNQIDAKVVDSSLLPSLALDKEGVSFNYSLMIPWTLLADFLGW